MSIIDRQKSILKIPAEYRVARPPAPKSAKIELVARCNYRCQYCPLSLREKQPTKDMDWGLFKSITRELHELGVEEIGVFYIGESMLNPSLLVSAILFLKRDLKVPYVFLTSNASLAHPEVVRSCMAAGLDSLKWSCNAYDNAQFERLMGVNHGSFERARANIKDAWRIRLNEGYKTHLAASSIMYTDKQRELMDSFIRDIRPYVDEHYFLPLYSAGGEAVNKEKELGFKPVAGNTGRVDDPSDPIPCWTLFTSAHILVDGKLTACCLDGTGKWVMGDLTEQSFMEAWNSDKFVALRQAHLQNDISGTICAKCALVD
jgi:MoaA/NifB/PqqE/SkfB family radical SAM enzyme